MRKDEEAFSTYLAHSGRIIEEHGADILKTYYCKGFDKIREAVEIPIVIAGGKKMPERKALQMVYRAVKAGANGGDLGRNVFKADYPIGIMQAINSIVHEGSTLKASIELYEHLKHTRDN
jgi:putative autoinducer-2 (AI-2) aldolase